MVSLWPLRRIRPSFLLGTTYGGDGRVTFALPNFQGSAPMQQGNGPGLTPRSLGEIGGSQQITLISNEMPQHTHQFSAGASGGRGGGTNVPTNNTVGNGATERTTFLLPATPPLMCR